MHIQRTVSTYLYLLYLTQTKTQYLHVNLDSFSDIGHSLFAIRREVGHLMDIRNIQY